MSANIVWGSMPLALVKEGASTSCTSIAMGCGMFAALLVSLPVGMMVDRLGRLLVLRISAFTSVLVMIAMGYTRGLIAGCLQMALCEAALVAYMTAQFAYASNLFAKKHAVSAVGAMGIIGNVAFATGPALGVWLWQHGIHREQYIYASVLNVVALVLVMTLPSKYDVRVATSRRRILFRPAWLPAMTYVLACTLVGGVNAALAVLTFQARGIANGALIFTASALTTVIFRYPAGRLVEKLGAKPMTVPTAIIQGCGCVLASQAKDSLSVIFAGICLGTAWAAVVPIGLALFFESSSQRSRGIAMGSYNLAFGSGASIGALIATIATMIGMGYTQAILCCALMPCLAVICIFNVPKQRDGIS